MHALSFILQRKGRTALVTAGIIAAGIILLTRRAGRARTEPIRAVDDDAWDEYLGV